MAYVLGIDLGTSCAVAAISRTGGGTELVALRVDTPGVPTVLHIADDGTMLVGAAAEPLMLSDPDHVFRSFLHRLDQPSAPDPLRSPATLTARLVRWIAEAVTEQEDDPPQQITLAHPAGWGSGECGALQAALIEFGMTGVVLVPAPLAAAAAHTAENDVTAGDVLAVYDLGAAFSISLVRCESDGFAILGEPRVLEDGGGAQFDEAVLARVLDELGDQVAAADLDDQAMLAGMATLLTDCVTAREALSARSVVTIPVSLPGLDARVRLTGDELRTLIDPTLRATVDSVRAAISSAGLRPADVSTVLVTGGCARMPAVAQLLATELGRPFAVLTDPELAAARGAALIAAGPGPSEPVAPPPSPGVPDEPAERLPADLIPTDHIPADHIPADVTPALPPADATVDTVPFPQVSAPFPQVPAHQPAAERHFRPQRRILLAVAAGILAAITVIVPLTLLRAPDSGAASVTAKQGDPNRGDPGDAGARQAPASTANAGIPDSSLPPPAVTLIEPRPVPPPNHRRTTGSTTEPTTSPRPDPMTTPAPTSTTTLPPDPTTTPAPTSTPPMTSPTTPAPASTPPTSGSTTPAPEDPTSVPPSSSGP